MRKYILGIDGGGTKTHCSVFNLDGEPVDFISWGKTNHECLKGSYSELKEELGKLFTYVFDKNSITADELGKCVFGLAGVDTKRQHGIISKIISDLGIKDFNLCNDVLKSPPVAGAVLWALEENGCKRHSREKVLNAFM